MYLADAVGSSFVDAEPYHDGCRAGMDGAADRRDQFQR